MAVTILILSCWLLVMLGATAVVEYIDKLKDKIKRLEAEKKKLLTLCKESTARN